MGIQYDKRIQDRLNVFSVTEDGLLLTTTCRTCGHRIVYGTNADPHLVRLEMDYHLEEYHPGLWQQINLPPLSSPSEPS